MSAKGARLGEGGDEFGEMLSCKADMEGHSKTQQDRLELAEKVRKGPGGGGRGRAVCGCTKLQARRA